MKKFEMPAMDVEKLDAVDVITASGDDCTNFECGNDTGEY